MASIAEVGASGLNIQRKKPDNLILVDAYWIKKYNESEIKIRLIPHQMAVDLYVEFVYEHDNDEYDKLSAPAFDLKFKVDGTIFDGKSTITINSAKLQKWDSVRKYLGPKSNYNGKDVYYLVIKDFISDLRNLKHKVIND